MKIKYIHALLFFFLLGILKGEAQSSSDQYLKLWYDKPASNWNEALPIGNGRLGAMIFGNPAMERLQLNEETIWAGSPNSNAHPESLEALPEVRKLIFEGKYKEAQALTDKEIMSKTNNGMPYQTFGNVYLSFPGHENYSNYKRELDIANATANVSYTVDGVTYKREMISAFKDDVIAIKLTASKPGKITGNILMSTPYDKTDAVSRDGVIMLNGTSGNWEGQRGGVDFEGRLAVKTKGGTSKTEDGYIFIDHADEATIYISIGTNFKNYKDLSVDARDKSKRLLKAAMQKDFDEIKDAHEAYYQNLFNRVSLDLGITDAVKQPTDLRIKSFSTQDDPQLVSLYFQFGRYLLISSSQPGGQPANLQGIWNDMLAPPWESKYTMNINAEMNYWPAELTNLPEMHQPFIQMAKELQETGSETAKIMYGVDGWVLHHNTDIWRITGPIDHASSGMWPSGGAWVCQDLWEKYLYSGDKDYLQEIYPVLKGAATFFLDFMVQDPNNGWLVVVPSNSPEHTHIGEGDKGKSTIAAGATMDNQLVFDLFSHVAEATKILAKDSDFRKQLTTAKEKLAPMQIGRYGQLQEWLEDWDDPDDNHRHVSHLYGLFPSNQISPFQNTELTEAAKVVLEHRGDESTGWSMGWKVNLWARLLDGDHAYKLLNDQLSLVNDQKSEGGSYPNMLDAHPPFQIDGNFGCTAGIAEMLMQSQEEAVHLLPALPDAWQKGEIKGLVARGNFLIKSMEWENHQLKKLVITSRIGGNLRLRSATRLKGKGLKKAKGENPNPFFKIYPIKKPLISEKASLEEFKLPEYYEYDVQTERGKSYTFYGK